jgi:RNA polymerase sigma-70 factor (ECF subfamily)
LWRIEAAMLETTTTPELRLDVLMRAVQDGDARAYALLLKEITPRLRQFVRRQRSSVRPEDLEDLLQDILLSLHSVRSTYNPELPFIPWLMAIARNRLVDGARKYRRSGMMEVQVDEYPVTFSSEETNIEAGDYRDPEALRQAVRQLPAGQRNAIELTKLRELSLREAAAASGMSIAALKVSVHRAMGSLRKTLKSLTKE